MILQKHLENTIVAVIATTSAFVISEIWISSSLAFPLDRGINIKQNTAADLGGEIEMGTTPSDYMPGESNNCYQNSTSVTPPIGELPPPPPLIEGNNPTEPLPVSVPPTNENIDPSGPVGGSDFCEEIRVTPSKSPCIRDEMGSTPETICRFMEL